MSGTMKGVILLLSVALVWAIDDETLKTWDQVDDTTWVNPATGEVYQPETAGGAIEGDMMFDDADGGDSRKRNTPFSFRTWTDGIVPYTFGAKWVNDENFKRAVKRGMDELESKTCIRYVPWTNQPHRINIIRDKGCTSYVGMQSWSQQNVDLSGGCTSIGIVMHELIHALGFNHEHERGDRVGFIDVNITNVKDDYKMWLGVRSQKLSSFGYDVDSVMHYGKHAFAKNWNYPVITQLKDFNRGRIGQRSHLSEIDIKEINQLYNCKNVISPTTPPKTTTTIRPGSAIIKACDFENGWCNLKRLGSEQRWAIWLDIGGVKGRSAGFRVGSNEVQSYSRNSRLIIGNAGNGQACLSLRYYIDRSGTLSVKIGRPYVRSFVNTYKWKTVKVPIVSGNYNMVELVVNMEPKQYGSIHIDDVKLTVGRC